MNELDKKYEGSKRYWYPEQEKAIVDYINSQDIEEKNRIYSKHLYKPMTKLIENIIFTYKLFRSDVEVKELQIDCMSFLITKIDKFNPKNGTQAFSYLGTIAKHYLMGESRVGEAIVWVFRNHELLKLYNKNTIYYLLKERTGLETKEITYSLSRFKGFYKIFKTNFLNKNK